MNKQLLLFSTLLIGLTLNAQYEHLYMEGNNAAITASNNGLLFNNSDLSEPGYEIPAGSGNHIIYSMGFWFGGPDINGNLKLAAQTYSPEGDLFRGPLTTGGAAEAPLSSEDYGVYLVMKSQIDDHIENYDDPGYEVPDELLEWPAHGDVSDGIDYYLAPFVDVNGNATYDPENGDYPKIKGDQAAYIILNDKANLHETGGDPIGLEIHLLVYQYATEDYLNDATFINMKVINRGTQTIYDFRTGAFLDGDLGYASDDFVGCLSDENLMFAYNGDNFDDQYGENPPAMGLKLLNHDVSTIGTFGNGGGPTGSPEIATDYYRYMGGFWKDGSPFTDEGTGYGVGEPTSFIYDGNPTIPTDWSEVSNENAPGDRKMIMATEMEVLTPFSIHCFDYVVLYNRDGDYLENVQNIIDQSAMVQSFYDSQEAYCEEGVVSLPKKSSTTHLTVYPNPSQGQVNVQFDGAFDLAIYTFDGRQVYSKEQVFDQFTIDTKLAPGTYIVLVTQNGKTYPKRIVVE